MKALFLSAGIGTRLRPFTDDRAKPAIPFLGIPLLHHVWHTLAPWKIDHLVVNLHHRAADVRATAELLLGESKGLSLYFSDEQDLLLDSGGGLHRAKKHFEKESCFALANGDEIFFLHDSVKLLEMKARHQSQKNIATLLVMQHPEVGSKFGGAYCSDDLKIKRFSKTPISGLKGWHYVGVMLLSSRIFQYMKPGVAPENLLYDALTAAIAAGESVEAHPATMNWYEVGNPNDFMAATREACSLIRNDGSSHWVDLLRQRIRWAFLEKPFIEKADPALLSEVSAVLHDLKNKID